MNAESHDWVMHAMRLYPTNVYLQSEWLRAITTVRATARGWVLEPPIPHPVPLLYDPPRIIARERTA
jgi:hypothetical protein